MPDPVVQAVVPQAAAMTGAPDDVTVAVQRFEQRFWHAWDITLRAEAAARTSGRYRAPELLVVLQALARSRDRVLLQGLPGLG